MSATIDSPAHLVARHRFERSIRLLRELQAEIELARALVAYAPLHRQHQEQDAAESCLLEAAELYERAGATRDASDARNELATLRGI
jgi:hypothetical protein